MAETTFPQRAQRYRHDHADAPDTSEDLARLPHVPEGPEHTELAGSIVEEWLPMAHRLAGKYRGRGESMDDLHQAAALGLVKAVERYDPERGTAFATFAVPTIVGEIRRHFRDYSWHLHVPRRVQELRNTVRAALLSMETGSGESPSVQEIAERTRLDVEDVVAGLKAMEGYRALSLDVPLESDEGDGFALADTLGEREPAYETVVAKEAARSSIGALPERERRALYLRYFHDMSQSRIAEDLGVSQMHVSRLLSRSCDRVRREVDGEPCAAASQAA